MQNVEKIHFAVLRSQAQEYHSCCFKCLIIKIQPNVVGLFIIETGLVKTFYCKGNEMNIYEALDRYNLLITELTNQDRYNLKDLYQQAIWIKATKLFLQGIGKDHQVPGRVLQTLYDMCSLADQDCELTHKQMLYMSNNLLDNWNQINYEIRSLLYI